MKIQRLIAGVACLALVVAFAVNANAEKEKKVTKVKCPVAGKEIKIDDAKVASYKDADIYVCCDKCKAALEKDAAKYAVKANHQLVLTGQAKQTKCPMTGRPINAKMTVKAANAEVGLCCGGCKGKASKASDDELLTLLFSDKAFKKGFEIVKKEKK